MEITEIIDRCRFQGRAKGIDRSVVKATICAGKHVSIAWDQGDPGGKSREGHKQSDVMAGYRFQDPK